MKRSQRLWIGIIFTLVGVGFAIWAFLKGCLEGAQPQIIQALIPLAAGFAAWSFYGSAHVTVEQSTPTGLKDLGVKVLIAATGGFAVWLVTIYILVPRSEALCKFPPPIREIYLSAVGEIRNLRANYGFAATDPDRPRKTLLEGPGAVQRLKLIDPKGLKAIDRIHQSAFAALGHLYIGIAWDKAEGNQEKAAEEAREALNNAEHALKNLTEFVAEGGKLEKRHLKEYAEGLTWIAQEHYDEFIYQLIGRAHLLIFKVGAGDYSEAKKAFQRVSYAYRRDNGLLTDWLIKWFCAAHPMEEDICA